MSTSKTVVVSGASPEEAIRDLLRQGMQKIAEAGVLFVKTVEERGQEFREKLANMGVSQRQMSLLEKIGRGQLMPELWIKAPRLIGLPVSEQKRILAEPVDALVLKEDGQIDVLKVNLLNAPPEMFKQLVNGDHIRTLDEQRAWLTARKNEAMQVDKPESSLWHVIRGKKIEVTRPAVLLRRDVLTMLSALEA